MEQDTRLHRELYDEMCREYVTQGAIYGQTHEGLMRWVKEVAEIYRSGQEALFWRQRHLAKMDKQMISARHAAVHEVG